MANSKSSTKKSSTKAAGTKKSSSRAKSAAEPVVQPPPIRREVASAIFLFLGVFCVISYFNTEGKFVADFTELMKGLLGWGFWLLAPAFLLTAYILGFHRGRPVTLRMVSALMLPILFAAMGNLMFYEAAPGAVDLQRVTGALFEEGQLMNSGGVIGGFLAIGLEKAFSIYGAMPILLLFFVFFLLKSFDSSLVGVADKLNERTKYDPAAYEVKTANVKAAAPDRAVKVERVPRTKTNQVSSLDIPLGDYNSPPVRESKTKTKRSEFDIPLGDDPVKVERIPRTRKVASTIDIPLGDEEEYAFTAEEKRAESVGSSETEVKPVARKVKAHKKDTYSPETVEEPLLVPAAAEHRNTKSAEADVGEYFREVPFKKSVKAESLSEAAVPAEQQRSRKATVKAEVNAEAAAMSKTINETDEADGDYRFPPLELLRGGVSAQGDCREEIRVNKERLEGAIRSFGINASIVDVTRGPTVTRYDFELEQGVKLARVTNLAGDLALALGVVNVRIAPIPDKISTVGIEVPNKIVSTVYLRDIIESSRFSSAKFKLSFALGKDIGGEAVVGNIAKLPHMLIAGTTGSGKSVCMNSLILSLLYKARPDEVKLVMIDPKMVELGVYNGIPHLYTPVVTDPKKAAGALQWSVVEMLKRYRMFSEVGVRDLENFNKHNAAVGEPYMPQVVIVIDELADLMMAASKEVEESICRVAQMGRAAGMHLVIATQRPSADVITGLMKANIPSRIAFAVSSAMESRIILDQGGAEKLIGMGDMLYSPVGCGKPTRIQGAFVSDEEREEVIQFIKESSCAPQESSQTEELESFMNKAAEDKNGEKDKGSKNDGPAGDFDEMLPQAVEAVLEMKSCSVSMLQRRVKLGYSRAARIVDQMEELGIVGPYEGAKPRSVIIDRNGWHDIQIELGLIPDDGLELAGEMSDSPNG